MSIELAWDRIGCPIEDIDTPALLIDAAALDRNIERMADFGRSAGIHIRPHAKAHKTPMIAHRQLKAGAIGICCQKVGEAEVMAAGGIPDILISNEVIGKAKLSRLVALARYTRITVAVDSKIGAEMLAEAAAAAGVTVGVVIDVDVGQGRCGVAPGDPAVLLGHDITKLPGIAFRGIQGYQGRLQHVHGYAQRVTAAQQANVRLMETKSLLERGGFGLEIVTGGGTGTYETEGRVAGMTEVQPGSYIFMDRQYQEIGGRSGILYDDFDTSLTVLATVVSAPTGDRVVLDAGLKALSNDAGPAAVIGLPGWTYEVAGDEHGILRRAGDQASRPHIGDRVHLLPSHCDTTVNLHDRFHVVRNGILESVLSIAARGRIQ